MAEYFAPLGLVHGKEFSSSPGYVNPLSDYHETIGVALPDETFDLALGRAMAHAQLPGLFISNVVSADTQSQFALIGLGRNGDTAPKTLPGIVNDPTPNNGVVNPAFNVSDGPWPMLPIIYAVGVQEPYDRHDLTLRHPDAYIYQPMKHEPLGSPNTWSPMFFGEFRDDTIAGNANQDVRGLLSRIEKQLGAAGDGRCLIASQLNQTMYVEGCAAAFADPHGQFYVLPTDIGNGFGQIPADPVNRQSAQFRAHPSVFVRKPSAFRSLVYAGSPLPAADGWEGGCNDEAITNAADSTVRVYRIDREPEYSMWQLVIDGASFRAIFRHTGGDFRRPRDIWENVILPLVLRAQGSQWTTSDDALTYRFSVREDALVPGSLTAPTFQELGLVRRLAYLEYARFLACWDEDAWGITTKEQGFDPNAQPA